MKLHRTALFTFTTTLFLAGCSGSGGSSASTNTNKAPEVVLLDPAQPLQAHVGDEIDIAFTDVDPDSTALSVVVAVPVSSFQQTLDETLSEILIAELPENDGVLQELTWDTEGVFPSKYVIQVRTSDEESTAVDSSAVVDLMPSLPTASDIQVFVGELTAFRTAVLSDGSTALAGLYANPLFLDPVTASPIVSTISGTTELVIARFRPDGSLNWIRHTQNQSPGSSTGFRADQLDLTATSDGRLVVVVSFDEAFDMRKNVNDVLFSCTPLSFGRSACAFSLFEDGELAWTRPIEGGPSTIASGLDASENGAVTFVGSFDGSVVLGSEAGPDLSVSASGQANGFVARLDSTGNPTWLRETELGNLAEAIDVATGDNGSYAVLGTFEGQVQFGEGQNTLFSTSLAGGRSAYLTIQGPSGNLLAAFVVHGEMDVIALDLIDVPEGFAFSTLARSIEVDDTNAIQYSRASSTRDLYVTRISNETHAFTLQTLESAGPTTPIDHLFSLEEEGENYLLVAGELSQPTTPENWSGAPFEATGGDDVFMGLIDESGTFLAGQQDGRPGTLRLLSLGVRGNGQPILGVRSEGTTTVGTNSDEPRTIVDQSAIVPVAPFAL